MPMFPSFFKRNKDSKKKANCAKVEDSSLSSKTDQSSHKDESHHDSSPHNSPRLEGNWVTRHPDNNEGNPNVWKSSDHPSKANSGVSWSSRSPRASHTVSRTPSNLDTVVPLPLHPKAKKSSVQHNEKLPSPWVRPAENRNLEGSASGYLTDSASSDCSSESGGHEFPSSLRWLSEVDVLKSYHSE